VVGVNDICSADVTSYFGTMRELSRMVVEILTECLGLEPDTFTKLETADAMCNARVNHYPACPDPSKVFGIHGHTDPQIVSIVFQDEVGGLQVLRNGKWIGIRPDDSTFVVNVGDTFQVLRHAPLSMTWYEHSLKFRTSWCCGSVRFEEPIFQSETVHDFFVFYFLGINKGTVQCT
jgi:hypothetical protein